MVYELKKFGSKELRDGSGSCKDRMELFVVDLDGNETGQSLLFQLSEVSADVRSYSWIQLCYY